MIQNQLIPRSVMVNGKWETVYEPPLTDAEAGGIIEDVLDTLTEVGNGTTNEMLVEALDQLFAFRDRWLKQRIVYQ